MKIFLSLLILVFFAACGVKGPPLPPEHPLFQESPEDEPPTKKEKQS